MSAEESGDLLIGGVVEDMAGEAGLDEASLVEDEHLGGDFEGLGEVVGDE